MADTSLEEDLSKETAILDQLKAEFPAAIIESEISRRNRPRIVIQPNFLLSVLKFAKNDLAFEHLSAIAGIDMIEHFAAVYMLGSWSEGMMLEVYVQINDRETPTLPSVTSIWKTANWHERETYDLFGFHFTDHPNLKRILLPDEWDEMPHEDPNLLHPLRKAYKMPENPFRLTRPVDMYKGSIDIDKWRETIE